MSRTARTTVLLALLAASLAPAAARAQVGVPVPVPGSDSATVPGADGCTYDTCALRIEEGALLRGAVGHPVTNLGVLGNVAAVSWSSDSARRYAQRAQTSRRQGAVMDGVASVTALASLAIQVRQFSRLGDESGGISRGEIITAAGLGVGTWVLQRVGRSLNMRARKELARAVWWHNREFARQERQP